MESHHNFIVKRTDSTNEDFGNLVALLDKELGENYMEEYDFYHKYNQIENINKVIVVYLNENPVGCGAIKEYDSSTMEVKRMFTQRDYRGKGVASALSTKYPTSYTSSFLCIYR